MSTKEEEGREGEAETGVRILTQSWKNKQIKTLNEAALNVGLSYRKRLYGYET